MALSFALGLLAAGFSEIITPIFILLVAIGFYRTRKRHYLFALVGLLLGFTIVLIAPGNAVRAAALPPRMLITRALQQAIAASAIFIAQSILERPYTLIAAFFVGWLCEPLRRVRKRLRWALVTVLLGFAGIIYSLFITLYGAGGLQGRHYTYAAFILVLTIGTLGMLCSSRRINYAERTTSQQSRNCAHQ